MVVPTVRSPSGPRVRFHIAILCEVSCPGPEAVSGRVLVVVAALGPRPRLGFHIPVLRQVPVPPKGVGGQ
eukprot:12057282-Alexandrium_andersonii.AAC.1